MSRLMVVVLAVVLAVVPASSALDLQYTYAGQGQVVAVYPLDGGGAAIVAVRGGGDGARMVLTYVQDGAANGWERVLTEPTLPDRVVTQAEGKHVHIVANWLGDDWQPVHHYVWTLPKVVVGPPVWQVFMPIQ